MVKIVQMVNRIPTTVEVNTGGATVYNESVLVTTEIGVAGTGYNAAHTVFTLPNGETYNGTKKELQIHQGDNATGGIWLVEGVHFEYGPGIAETTITMLKAVPKDARITFIKIT